MGQVKAPDIPRPTFLRSDLASEPESNLLRLQKEVIGLKSRATGRTTRIVDEVIQQLYRNPGQWIALFDHYYESRSEHHLYNMIMRRMEIEHPHDVVEKRQGNISAVEIRLAYCPAREYFERKANELQQLIKERREERINEIKRIIF